MEIEWLKKDMAAKSGVACPILFDEAQKLMPELESDWGAGSWCFPHGDHVVFCTPFWEAQNQEECTYISICAEDFDKGEQKIDSIPFLPMPGIEETAKEWDRVVREWIAANLPPVKGA